MKISFSADPKYSPGAEYHKTVVGDSIYMGEPTRYHYTEVVPGMGDTCSMAAYLYEVSSLDETLDGANINNSPMVVMRAIFPELFDLPTDGNYITTELDFKPMNNRVYDPKKLYKLAIVCSSSIRGDQFMGAPGSVLSIKRLEVINK